MPHLSVLATAGLILGTFVVYVATLAPGLTFIDSGELAAVASTLGVAHPTGYPLFTLLGHIASLVPVPGEAIFRLNLMAALFCAAGAGVFFHVMLPLIPSAERRRLPAAVPVGAAAGATMLLAFSPTYWSQATSIEVYSLHILLLMLVLLTFLRAISGTRRGDDSPRTWWLSAFILGLSFCNHMTTVLLLPGFAYLYFATLGLQRSSWMRACSLLIPFLLGLSLTLYLPIRAAESPLMNWGDPDSLQRLFWHLGGKQYRVWLFSSSDAAGRHLLVFLKDLPRQFAYVGLVLAVPGCVGLWRAHRRIFITLLILFCTCILYAINYDIQDIDSYFLLAYISLAIVTGFGAWMAGDSLLRWGIAPMTTGLLLVVLGLIPLAVNLEQQNERENHLVEDYTANMFASVQPGALVLSYQWDYWVAAAYYVQLVRGERPDVVVVDKELLRRSWYLKQLESRYPWLIDRCRKEVDGFLREVEKFEHDVPYNPAVIEARYQAMIAAFIDRCYSERPVYVTPEIEPEYTRGWQRVPEGLALRLYADSVYHPGSLQAFQYRKLERKGRLEDMIRRLYADAFAGFGEYAYMRGGNVLEAKNAIQVALSYDPTSMRARRMRDLIR